MHPGKRFGNRQQRLNICNLLIKWSITCLWYICLTHMKAGKLNIVISFWQKKRQHVYRGKNEYLLLRASPVATSAKYL